MHRPHTASIRNSEGFERRGLRILPAVADRLIEPTGRKINPVQPHISMSAPSSLAKDRYSSSLASAAFEVGAVITVIIVKIKISAGLRPTAAARRRMSATIGAITCFEGPLINTHSA